MTRTTIPSVAFFSSKQVAAALPSDIVTTTLFVTNIHCASCVTHVQDTIKPLDGIFRVDVNLLSHTICVQHEPGLTPKIADVLVAAAFEVSHVTTSDASGRVISTYDVSSNYQNFWGFSRISLFTNRAEKKHIANCKACQTKKSAQNPMSRSWVNIVRKRKLTRPAHELPDLEVGVNAHPDEHTVAPPFRHRSLDLPTRHVAIISIVGMTCASCTNAITAQLQQVDLVEDVRVNLLSNNAKVTFNGAASDALKIVETIEDCGFDATLDSLETLSKQRDALYKANISIGGMTCGSCVAPVKRAIEAVDGVSFVSVDLMGNCATLEVSDRAVLDKVLEAVEDTGFDASLGPVEKLNVAEENSVCSERIVEFEITGMYCPMCPTNIVSKLQDALGESVDISSQPSLKEPRIRLRYTPSQKVNIRRLKYTIETADPAIIATVYHQPSMEERSQAVQRRESERLLRHLLFTLIAAIPSFIIGIVFMSLVPQNNPTRVWFEQPIWIGNAMRMDWAMLIITLPVMFYGAWIFHQRAVREIWSLWRPKSNVPVFRRLYRFGSMNLLISAGTSVAFFSSLAILIMEASTPRQGTMASTNMQTRRSNTYFDTVTFLTLFVLCGKWLQAYSKAKTGDAVAMLGQLRPTHALLVDQNVQSWEEGIKAPFRTIEVDLLEVGDIVSIPHGASPPTDGVVDQEGTFLFNESSLTGESRPVRKTRGDTILTGSVNVSDPVRIVVKELGGRSMLDQIIIVVRDGQAKRAPIERVADLVTSYFTPVITLIAILTWTIWLALGETGILPRDWLEVDQGGWTFWSVEFAIAVFVVACPCGLGLAAPTALFVGGGLAAKEGILVQGGGEAFQEASKLDAIVFDKTGTLTEGQMRVTDVQMLDEQDADMQFQLALHLTKALEESCTHPIAKAIAVFCDESKGREMTVTTINVQETPGEGMRGIFEVRSHSTEETSRYEAAIGNERQLAGLECDGILATQSKSLTTPKHVQRSVTSSYLSSLLSTFQSTGCSTAVLSVRKLSTSSKGKESGTFNTIAVFAITDPIRSEALDVLRAIRSQHVDVHMCSGDNETTARAVASQLDIPVSNVRAGVLPQDKATYIQELQRSADGQRRIIAFVGDGTNDTPALTAADVSIALSSGSDIALTSSSFILLNSNLGTILRLVRLAKRVFLRVKLNFAWAFVYNLILIPVAAGVLFPKFQWRLNPAWAAAAMALSSVSVVLSSLALKWIPELRMPTKMKS